jgi:hypothetical protein
MNKSALLIACALLPMLSGCGLFDEDKLTSALDITYTEDFEISLPIDAAALCPADADCTGTAAAAPQDQPLKPLEVAIDLDIATLTGNPELASYAGKFKSVNISRIAYAAPDNSLTFDLPPINLYVGPLGTMKGTSAGALKLATIPSIPAKMNASGDAPLEAGNATAISDRFKSLQAAIVTDAAPVIKRGQPFPPSGTNNVKITLYVTFVANPADAIK